MVDNYSRTIKHLESRRSRLMEKRQKLLRKWGGLFFGTPMFCAILPRFDHLLDQLDLDIAVLNGRTHRWRRMEDARIWWRACSRCRAVVINYPYTCSFVCRGFDGNLGPKPCFESREYRPKVERKS